MSLRLSPAGAPLPAAEAPQPRQQAAPRWWCLAAAGSGALRQLAPPPRGTTASGRWCHAAVVPWRLRRETITGNNPFLLHDAVHVLQGVNSFSNMAYITPTTSLVWKIPETSENPTCYPNKRKKRTGLRPLKKRTLALQCLYSHTHTHTHMWRLHGQLIVSLVGKILLAARQRKGR